MLFAVFDVPKGSPKIWKRLVFDNFVCADDCDLHGLDLSTIAADSTVDLNGHKMYITALDGSQLNPFTVTNTVHFARWSHLRFQVFDVVGPNSDAMQFSEMKIFSSTEEISHSNAIVEWDRVAAPASGSPHGRIDATPDLLFDGDLDTKWCDLRGSYTESDEVKAALWFMVTYPEPVEVAKYMMYTAGDTDYFPSVELQDGASLDLSEKPEGWSLISANTTTNRTYAVSFASNAKISVQVGSRRLRNQEQLVSWEGRPEQVDFKLISTSLSGRLIVNQSGIFYTCSMVVVIR